MSEAARRLELSSVSDAPEAGPVIKRRRERLGMSQVALAHEAKVDRGRLAKLEQGDPSVQQRTIGAVLSALDRVERLVGAPPATESEGDPDRPIKLTVRGNFGVETTIEGSARDIDALEDLAARLIDRMSRTVEPDSPLPEMTAGVREVVRNHQKGEVSRPARDVSGDK